MKHGFFTSSVALLGLFTSCGDGNDEPIACNLSVASESVSAAQCGQATGSISMAASGENGLVTYRLDDGVTQNSATFDALAPGDYTVTVEDEAGCTATTAVTVTDEEATLMATAVVQPSACNESDGSIALDVSGGTAPYAFSIDSTNFTDDATLQNLFPGEYTVTIRDAEGCATNISARIPSGISFEESIQDIITTNCAVTGCHAAGGRNPNLEIKDNILANATRIRDRTTEKSMPPASSGRSLTDEQIAQINCWVGDGAADN